MPLMKQSLSDLNIEFSVSGNLAKLLPFLAFTHESVWIKNKIAQGEINLFSHSYSYVQPP